MTQIDNIDAPDPTNAASNPRGEGRKAIRFALITGVAWGLFQAAKGLIGQPTARLTGAAVNVVRGAFDTASDTASANVDGWDLD